MKMVMRPRYYCDHCKKANGSAFAMKNHEKGCTANPLRRCGLCKHCDGAESLEALKVIALTGNLTELQEAAGHCPACMLAAIRQANWPEKTETWNDCNGKSYTHTSKDIPFAIQDWNFKAALKELWDSVNDERKESYY